jgi:hypothetical protein
MATRWRKFAAGIVTTSVLLLGAYGEPLRRPAVARCHHLPILLEKLQE